MSLSLSDFAEAKKTVERLEADGKLKESAVEMLALLRAWVRRDVYQADDVGLIARDRMWKHTEHVLACIEVRHERYE